MPVKIVLKNLTAFLEFCDVLPKMLKDICKTVAPKYSHKYAMPIVMHPNNSA